MSKYIHINLSVLLISLLTCVCCVNSKSEKQNLLADVNMANDVNDSLPIESGIRNLIVLSNKSANKNSLGSQLDETDLKIVVAKAKQVMEFSLDNEPVNWYNPKNNHNGTFLVSQTDGIISENLVCRDFSHTLKVGSEAEKVSGRACREMWDSSGNWILYG